MINNTELVDYKSRSGKLPKSEKAFYLKLALEVIKKEDDEWDRKGFLNTRKEIMG